ncbi:MAG: hypothetical protein JWR69_905 [Pedosphaera sp.]|nr:hypothetical protein [Pedosphaera sp.]
MMSTAKTEQNSPTGLGYNRLLDNFKMTFPDSISKALVPAELRFEMPCAA